MTKSNSSPVLTENDVKMFASATGVRQSKLRAITSICVKNTGGEEGKKNNSKHNNNNNNTSNIDDQQNHVKKNSSSTNKRKSPTNNLRISTARRKRSRIIDDSSSSSSSSSSSPSDDNLSEASPNSSNNNNNNNRSDQNGSSDSPKYKQKLSPSVSQSQRLRKPILSSSEEQNQVNTTTTADSPQKKKDSEESTEHATTTTTIRKRRRRTSVTKSSSSPSDTSSPPSNNEKVNNDKTLPKFEFINKNIYIGGKPALSDYDAEEHVCNCTIPQGKIPKGYVFCGNGCVNRMLNIECDKHLCPCGTRCSNQRFRKREWANVEIRDSGPKGRGLFTKEKLAKGQFVIEYVGEVCDEETYQERMQEYDGERHFYFLSLDSQHVIDASRKGNKARYINHSCNPNCELQKWLVGCETRVGIFAIKDVPVNTELTFDYAMEVYGLKRQKCYCGETNCRGSIRSKEKEEKVLTAEQLERMETVKRRNKMRQVTKYTLKNQDDFKITDLIEEAAYDNQLFLIRNLRRGIRQRILDLMKAQRYYEAESEESENDVDEFGLTARERRRQLERYEALQKMHLPAVRTTRGSAKSHNSKPIATNTPTRKPRQTQSRKKKVRDESTSGDESSSEEEQRPTKKKVVRRRRRQNQRRSTRVESDSEETSESDDNDDEETSESEPEEKPKQRPTLRKPKVTIVEKKKVEATKEVQSATSKKQARIVKSDGSSSDEFEFKPEDYSDSTTTSTKQKGATAPRSTKTHVKQSSSKMATPRKMLTEPTVVNNKKSNTVSSATTRENTVEKKKNKEQNDNKQNISTTTKERAPVMVKKVLSSGNGIFALLDRKPPTQAQTNTSQQTGAQKAQNTSSKQQEAKSADLKKRPLEQTANSSMSKATKRRKVIRDNEE